MIPRVKCERVLSLSIVLRIVSLSPLDTYFRERERETKKKHHQHKCIPVFEMFFSGHFLLV